MTGTSLILTANPSAARRPSPVATSRPRSPGRTPTSSAPAPLPGQRDVHQRGGDHPCARRRRRQHYRWIHLLRH
ncbi:Os11g0463801 [Oryza sativa Japonica Group]|uniref:Os11g0463801 protein n=1 Tax=Oryza sativa subsp. japonica TaxID=39947 RepID=C7J8A9_ORYSJ|nr:Os11g0463801 [Oryza sativa Japonica Group]|eukprot:NP_001176530.1 Os11g0463801 [Oryza sativa Japonica Group]